MTQTAALAGKVAIVTGGNRGIGRAIAKRLARDGAALMLAARDTGALAETVREIEEAGGIARASALDLRLESSATVLVDATIAAFGGIDMLVNNAGATKRGAFTELGEAEWADGFALKFFGAVRLTRVAWPHLKARGGSVLMMGGTGAHQPGIDFSIGGSVNAALQALTKSLAELGVIDGVQINAINPGYIRSDRWQARARVLAASAGISEDEASRQILAASQVTRLGEPEDVADLTAYLFSPAGRFMHGSLVDIDGGLTKSV